MLQNPGAMNIVVFGASRGVGRLCVDTAIQAGHAVTAVARNRGTLDSAPATIVIGDVLDPSVVERAIAGTDAAIVALGVSPGSRSKTPEDVCSRGTRIILAAMDAAKIERVVVVTSYGVGATRVKTPFPFNLIAATLLKGIMADKEVQEQLVRASGTRWTIVQPLGLTDGGATGTPYVAADGSRKSSRVARADVAAVCIDALEHDKYVRECVAVSA
jgi:putative NADH-flavin reductase